MLCLVCCLCIHKVSYNNSLFLQGCMGCDQGPLAVVQQGTEGVTWQVPANDIQLFEDEPPSQLERIFLQHCMCQVGLLESRWQDQCSF